LTNKNTRIYAVFISQDTGIGMSQAEMIENLGTIARSGSKAFVEKLASSGEGSATRDNIIGQFGVGFYASFMVGDRLTVTSRSCNPEEPAHEWESDGSGKYSIAPVDGAVRGTAIRIHLREGDEKVMPANRATPLHMRAAAHSTRLMRASMQSGTHAHTHAYMHAHS